jgi:hypothetical protein
VNAHPPRTLDALVALQRGLPPGRTPAVLREWAKEARRRAAEQEAYAADLERQATDAEAAEREARVT